MAALESGSRIADLLENDALSSIVENGFGERTVLELEPFFRDDVARLLAEAISGAKSHPVYARTPDGNPKVIGYAPHVSAEEWEDLPERSRFLRFDQVDEDLLREDPKTADIVSLLEGPSFRSLLDGTDAHGLNQSYFDMHLMRDGDFHGWHTDAREGRKIGMIVYLTPQWREEYGGLLESRRAGRTVTYTPSFNKALLFHVDGLGSHRVTPIVGEKVRATLGMWFLS